MALKGFPFTSLGHDRRYGASDWSQYFSHLVGNGVFAGKASELQVVAGSNMTINILSGSGWIDGIIAVNSDIFQITLANASGVATRTDRIVLRLNMTNREMELLAIKGTTTAPPELIRDGTLYDLSLATILVPTGTTAILQSMITDTRPDAAICGWVSGIIDQIDTTGLFEQFRDSFDIWFDHIKGLLSVDAAGNLQNQIDLANATYGYLPDKVSKKQDTAISQMINLL